MYNGKTKQYSRLGDGMRGNMRRRDRQIKDVNKITAVLDACRTASVAMIDGDMPYVIPLSYGYEMEENSLILYFHCAREGRKIEVLKRNNKVCFTVFCEGQPLFAETPCQSGYYFSSVVGSGTVEFIENSAEKRHALRRMFAHQSGKEIEFTDAQADSVCVFRILSEDYTGKQKQKP